MSTKFTHTWTGAGGTVWPDFTRVVGAALSATIYAATNQGGAGTVAGERWLQSDFFPNIRDYKVDLDLDWDDAITTGRHQGLAVRLTDDGQTAYLAVLFSYRPSDVALNLPHLILYRRRSGTDVVIVAETDISGTIAGTDLNGSVTLRVRVETSDESTVNLKVSVDKGGGFVQFIDYDDTNAARIESEGTVGIRLGSTSVDDNILCDNLTVLDFEDEAVDTDYQSGLALKVNGVTWDLAALVARGIAAINVNESYVSGAGDVVADITDINEWHSPALQPGDDIEVLFNNAVYASGTIRPASRDAANAEGNAYQIHGPKLLARSVPLTNPLTGGGTIYYNEDSESENYDANRANMTIGDIIADIFDLALEGQDGLRAVGAAPSSGTAYTIPAGMTNGPVLRIQVSGTFSTAIEALLAYMPAYAWYVAPATRAHEFHHRPSASTYSIDTDGPHEVHRLDIQPENARTAVLIRGGKSEVTFETFKLSDGSLSPGWDTSLGLENEYESSKRNKSVDRGTVTAFGVKGSGPFIGQVYVQTTGITDLTDQEWRETHLTFEGGAENGNFYIIDDNTAGSGEFIFSATAWQSGGPAVTDPFRVSSAFSLGGRDNLWEEMHRTYAITDPNKNIASGECGTKVTYSYPLPTGGTGQSTMSAQMGTGDNSGRFKLSGPALLPLGLQNYPGDAATNTQDCAATGPNGTIGDISAELPIAQPEAPTLRVPAIGFRGTAFATDAGKWNGGGEAGVGDPKVKTLLIIDDSEFQYPGVQAADYTKLADAILEALGELPIRADIRLEAHDPAFLGLNKRIQLADTGNRTTGFESATNLWIMEVRYSWTADGDYSTQVLCGTQSTFYGQNLDSIRRGFTETAAIKNYRMQLANLEKVYNCLRDFAGFNGGASGQSPNSPTCASEISYSNSSRSEKRVSVKAKFDFVQEIIDGPISDFIFYQKGVTLNIADNNADGEPDITATDSYGSIWGWENGGWVWKGGTPPAGRGSPFHTTHPHNMPNGGVEGIMWGYLSAVLDFIKAQKGITIGVPSGVIPTVVIGPDTFTYNPATGLWANSGGGPDVDSPLDVDADGVPENIGGFEGILFKGLEAIQSLLTAQKGVTFAWDNAKGKWEVTGPAGVFYYNHATDGWENSGESPITGNPLDVGGDGEPEGLGGFEGALWANKKALEAKTVGLLPSPNDTGGDPTVTDLQGNIYTPTYVPGGDIGYTKSPDSPAGLGGPATGGLVGNLAGKCGTTEDGAAYVGSGPGSILAPGATIGAAGGYYYPPTEAGGQPDVEELVSGDWVPASTLRLTYAALEAFGLTPHDKGQRLGVVFFAAATSKYYVMEPSTGDFRRVTSVTAGTGENDSDYDWFSPSEYIPAGVVAGDHGTLTGLADDDHLQYHNDSRGDARYSLLAHVHAGADITTGTVDGDRLPALSATKRGAAPLTGTPADKFLRDDATWQYPPAVAQIKRSVTDKTAAYTVLTGETNEVFTNRGATGTFKYTLPAATAGNVGVEYTFIVVENQTLEIEVGDTGTDTLRQAGAAGTLASQATIGRTMTITLIAANEWYIISQMATWTIT